MQDFHKDDPHKADPHKSQWERIYQENMKQTKDNDDIYYFRAMSCKRLLEQKVL